MVQERKAVKKKASTAKITKNMIAKELGAEKVWTVTKDLI
jgi:hypothetical protein